MQSPSLLLLIFASIALPSAANVLIRDATTVSKHFQSGNNLPNYQAFGIIELSSQGNVAETYEAVLLSERLVLTASDCGDAIPNKNLEVVFKYRGQSIDIDKNAVYKTNEVGNRYYYLIKLGQAPTDLPDVFPFLSWFAPSETNDFEYGVRPEFIDSQRVFLSSYFSYLSQGSATKQKDAENALKQCYVEDRENLIAIKCPSTSACDGSTVLSGASFFTFSENSKNPVISITGLVSLKDSGKFCKDEPVYTGGQSCLKNSNTVDCSVGFVCGKRFTRLDVESILKKAEQIQSSSMKFHTDYVPDGSIIASFDMQGLKKYGVPPFVEEKYETLRNIIERADILALQRASVKLADTNSKDFKNFDNNVLQKMKDCALKAENNFAFVYDETKFVASACETIKANVIVRCTFRNKITSKEFSLFSVFLSSSGSQKRINELIEIQNKIKTLTSANEVIIITGDFSVGAGKGTNTVDGTKEVMQILEDMQFPDPGPTLTSHSAESRYDRFAVSKNIRLVYDYFPQHTEQYVTVGKSVGTTNDAADPNVPQPTGNILTRKSKQVSSCPPSELAFPIDNQDGRIKFFMEELLACYPENLRKYLAAASETIQTTLPFRDEDLSDHLPIGFSQGSVPAIEVASWNLEGFDPTVDPIADKNTFQDTKEVMYLEVYTNLFNRFDVVAVQELNPVKMKARIKTDPNNKYSHIDNDVMRMNKKWYWSSKPSAELGFAVGNDFTLKNCEDVNMQAVRQNNPRDAFKCDLYKITTNTYMLTLYNVHIKNAGSSWDVACDHKDVMESQTNPTNSDSTYLLGDFNTYIQDTRLLHSCPMTFATQMTYTSIKTFNRIDYVWQASSNKPSLDSCRTYNPELLRNDPNYSNDNSNANFIFVDHKDNNQKLRRLKAFSSWKPLSEHYPVFMKFYVP